MDAEGQFVICVDPGTCIGVQGGISNKVIFRPWSWRRLMPGHLGDGITEGGGETEGFPSCWVWGTQSGIGLGSWRGAMTGRGGK